MNNKHAWKTSNDSAMMKKLQSARFLVWMEDLQAMALLATRPVMDACGYFERASRPIHPRWEALPLECVCVCGPWSQLRFFLSRD